MGQKPSHSVSGFLCSASSETEIKVSAGLSSHLGGLGKDVLQLVQVIGRFTAYGWKTGVPLSSPLSAGDCCQLPMVLATWSPPFSKPTVENVPNVKSPSHSESLTSCLWPLEPNRKGPCPTRQCLLINSKPTDG